MKPAGDWLDSGPCQACEKNLRMMVIEEANGKGEPSKQDISEDVVKVTHRMNQVGYMNVGQ